MIVKQLALIFMLIYSQYISFTVCVFALCLAHDQEIYCTYNKYFKNIVRYNIILSNSILCMPRNQQ